MTLIGVWTHSVHMCQTSHTFTRRAIRCFLICLVLAGAVGAFAAEHRALLPRPQEVQYGSGSLPVGGLSICFAGAATAEDSFAAEELAIRLSGISRAEVLVRKSKGPGASILLNRTGTGAALPGDKESTGAESREAYTIEVRATGAEIRAGSSAGLFYGVQTLLQMVEGTGAQAALPAAEIRDWPALAYRGVHDGFQPRRAAARGGDRAAD